MLCYFCKIIWAYLKTAVCSCSLWLHAWHLTNFRPSSSTRPSASGPLSSASANTSPPRPVDLQSCSRLAVCAADGGHCMDCAEPGELSQNAISGQTQARIGTKFAYYTLSYTIPSAYRRRICTLHAHACIPNAIISFKILFKNYTDLRLRPAFGRRVDDSNCKLLLRRRAK